MAVLGKEVPGAVDRGKMSRNALCKKQFLEKLNEGCANSMCMRECFVLEECIVACA